MINILSRTNHGHMNLMLQSKNAVNNGLLVRKQFLEFLYSTVLYDSDSIYPGKTLYLSVCFVMCVFTVVVSLLPTAEIGVEWQIALGSTAVVMGTILLHKPQGTVLSTFIADYLDSGVVEEEAEGLLNGDRPRWRWEE